jgi:hypothetical protein
VWHPFAAVERGEFGQCPGTRPADRRGLPVRSLRDGLKPSAHTHRAGRRCSNGRPAVRSRECFAREGTHIGVAEPWRALPARSGDQAGHDARALTGSANSAWPRDKPTVRERPGRRQISMFEAADICEWRGHVVTDRPGRAQDRGTPGRLRRHRHRPSVVRHGQGRVPAPPLPSVRPAEPGNRGPWIPQGLLRQETGQGRAGVTVSAATGNASQQQNAARRPGLPHGLDRSGIPTGCLSSTPGRQARPRTGPSWLPAPLCTKAGEAYS